MLSPLIAVAVLATAPHVAADGARAENPWTPFIGCWSPVGGSASDAAPQSRQAMTCILPVDAEAFAADVVEFQGGVEQRRSRLRADGTSNAVQSAGCVGTESARFAMDGARLFVRGTVACANGPVDKVVAIFEITASGRLLHVRGRDDATDPRVEYRTLGAVASTAVPSSLRIALQPLDATTAELRSASANRALSSEVVAEATRSVPAAVAEIWIAAMVVEGATSLEMNDEIRDELHGAGVPPRVVSLLDALADPDNYFVTFSSAGATTYSSSQSSSGGTASDARRGSRRTAIGQNGRCRDLSAVFDAMYGRADTLHAPPPKTSERQVTECSDPTGLQANLRALDASQVPKPTEPPKRPEPPPLPANDPVRRPDPELRRP